MTITLAAVQVRATASRDENIRHARQLIESAVERGADVIVMPEIFSAPFVTGEVDLGYFAWAEALDGPTNSMVAELSAAHGVTIVSSIFEAGQPDGVYHNTAVTYHCGEPVLTYRKSHLPFSNAFPEKFYFRPGDQPPSAVHCGSVSVGTIICYERHFPELGRLVALAGGVVMAVPVACASLPTREIFQVELRAQAIFNELFVVCANRVGTESGKTYYGTSAIYGPDGAVLAQASTDDAEVITAEVDIDTVIERRHVLPFLRDRRPDLYGHLAR
jgi:beta-ureidopropionase